MIVEHRITFTRTQAKMMDCWYACIRMIKGTVAGAPGMAAGAATQAHRSAPVVGKKLSFASAPGADIMRENNLTDVSGQIRLSDINTLARALQQYGPLIVGGKFAFFNTQGHFVVISGCNTDDGTVSIYDPGWGKGKDTKQWSYITQHCFKLMGDDDSPGAGTFVADNPAAFFGQATRGRR